MLSQKSRSDTGALSAERFCWRPRRGR